MSLFCSGELVRSLFYVVISYFLSYAVFSCILFLSLYVYAVVDNNL